MAILVVRLSAGAPYTRSDGSALGLRSLKGRFDSSTAYQQHLHSSAGLEHRATNAKVGGSNPSGDTNTESKMSKVDKKKVKLQERLTQLETDLRLALQKKSSSAAKIDVPGKTRQIQELRAQIAVL